VLVVRHLDPETGRAAVALAAQDEDAITQVHPLHVPDMAFLLRSDRATWERQCDAALRTAPVAAGPLLAPVDGLTEVWAAGVTYRHSRDARHEESAVPDVYDRVYDAVRPELFLKSVAWRVRGHRQPVGIRSDSDLNVPEPELALAVNPQGEVLAYAVCNDMSSRQIEGENPLYLPQAKIYGGACALGPGWRPAWEVPDAYALRVSVSVLRGAETVWHDETSTGQLHRTFVDLIEHLLRADNFPDGVVLSTGTGVVPGLDVTLHVGDVVDIAIDWVGRLVNHVDDALVAAVR
jgi:2-dehydro-3-deoxy-D-arabinonate dehydratase